MLSIYDRHRRAIKATAKGLNEMEVIFDERRSQQ